MTRVLVSPGVRGIYDSLMIVIGILVAKKDTRVRNWGVRGPQKSLPVNTISLICEASWVPRNDSFVPPEC